MRDALEQTRKAADATRDSVTQASDTAIRQLRAYLGVHQIGVMGIRDNQPLGLGLAIINHGQTPASMFNMKGIIDLLPYPLPDDFLLPDPPDRAAQDGIVFPNETNPMTGWVWEREGHRLSVAEKAKLFSKETTQEIYAHGIATYADIFGTVRQTEFCFVLNPHSVVRNEAGDIIHDKNGNQWECSVSVWPGCEA